MSVYAKRIVFKEIHLGTILPDIYFAVHNYNNRILGVRKYFTIGYFNEI